MELQPILHVWIHPDNDLVDLTITTPAKAHHGSAPNAQSEVVQTNQKHPFLTTEHGFLPVKQIMVGMHVMRADGSIGLITRWTIVPCVMMMYNLEVAQDHTFTVGDGQWVVHNCGGSGPAFPTDTSKIGHIFRNAPGHLADDTPANRQLITDTASDSNYLVGTDKYGKEWYAQTLSNGKQAWVAVRNDIITNAGVNDTPWMNWDPERGIVP
jgi:hypothetical protein